MFFPILSKAFYFFLSSIFISNHSYPVEENFKQKFSKNHKKVIKIEHCGYGVKTPPPPPPPPTDP